MDFELEDFVPLFTRDTVTWLGWVWQTRAVLPSLLRKVDRRGRLEWSPRHSPARAVSKAIQFPEDVVDVALLELQQDETIQIGERWLLVVNHERARTAVEASLQRTGHAAAKTTVERSRAYRERRRASKQSGRHEERDDRDASRDAVTFRDAPLPLSALPSSPSVSLLEPPFHSPTIHPTSPSPLAPPEPAASEAEPRHSVESVEEARATESLSLPGIDVKPTKSRKGKPKLVREDYPAELEAVFLDELRAACETVKRRGPRKVGEDMRDQLRKLWAACEPTADDLRHVIAVRCEMTRRGEGYGHLTWDSICVPGNFRRWLAQALGRPAQGRAEPSARPAQSGVVDLKAAMARRKNEEP